MFTLQMWNLKRKKKYSSQKAFELLRRKNELEEYGKLLSLRPSKVHESKKRYKRNKRINLDDEN